MSVTLTVLILYLYITLLYIKKKRKKIIRWGTRPYLKRCKKIMKFTWYGIAIVALKKIIQKFKIN
jgi:O-antigen/teichoic acid export membrane protein